MRGSGRMDVTVTGDDGMSGGDVTGGGVYTIAGRE
jgi:hypothetical protein